MKLTNKEKIQLSRSLYVIALFVIIIGIIVDFVDDDYKIEYEYLGHKMALERTEVRSVQNYRGATRIFTSDKRWLSIPPASTKIGNSNSFLASFLRPGDEIHKFPNSDTLYINADGGQHIFIYR